MRAAIGALALLGLVGVLPGPAGAQSAHWSSSLLVPTYPSPFFAEWQRNPGNASLTLVYTGDRSVDYRVVGELRRVGQGLVGRAESPVETMAPGPTTVRVTAGALDGWNTRIADRRLQDEVLSTGVIPEGDYELCTRAETPQAIQLTESCTRFTIALPDAPELLYPDRRQTVTVDQPTFQWTPVLVPPSLGTTYRLRIAERLSRQTPQTALAANVPQLDLEVGSTPLFLYPADGLPLEAGKEYAWQVEALDGSGRPLGPTGLKSQIWTFRVARAGVVRGGPDAVPDIVTVVPGLARLTGVSAVEAEATPFGYVLNGTVWLELADPYRTRLRVQLRDLEIDATAEPRITGGGFVGRLGRTDLPSGVASLRLDGIRYEAGGALEVTGALALAGDEVTLEGAATVTGAGLYGTLESEDPAGLFTAGTGPVSLQVTRVGVDLPDGRLNLGGAIGLFGEPTDCLTGYGPVTDGQWTARAFCTPDLELPLAASASGARLAVRSIDGSVTLSPADGAVTADLSADAELMLDADGTCSALLGLDVGTELSVAQVTPSCPATGAPIDLGWLALRTSNLRVESLGYAEATGFDLDIRVDIEPSVPASPSLPLPLIRDVRVTADGLAFGAAELDASAVVELGGFGLRIATVASAPTRLAWTDIDAGSPGDLAFDLDAELTLPEMPASAPGCLAARPIALASTTVADGRLTATLDAGASYDPTRCRIPLGVATLGITGLGGAVEVSLGDSPELAAAPEVTGRLYPGAPLTCDAQPAWIPLAGIGLRPDGGLTGAATDLQMDCQLDVGGAAVRLTGGRFEADGETVVLAATGEATFAAGESPVTAAGELEVDLTAGAVTGGSLEFTGPLRLDLVPDATMLSFQVDGARLDEGGLRFDGAATLALPDGGSIAATFDGLTFGFGDAGITAGRVTFEDGFGLEAEIVDRTQIAWRAVAAAATPPATGVRITVPAGASIGPDGFTVAGEGAAHLRWGQQDLADLDVGFSSDLVFGLTPPAIEDGRIDVLHQGVTVAYFDDAGFHPSLAYLGEELLPDRLPLPNENVAYLQLRDTTTGDLRVAWDTAGEGVRVYTPPNQPVPLVVPAIQGTRPSPPTVDVMFDVRVDEFGSEVVGGEVVAGVPSSSPDFDLTPLGVPLTLDTLAYRDPGTGYVLEAVGRPVLADGLDPMDAEVRLAIDAMGRLAGSFDVDHAGTLRLFGTDSAGLSVAYDGVRGSIDADLAAGTASWSVELPGELRLGFGSGEPYAVGAMLVASNGGISLQDFGAAGGETRRFGYGGVELEVSDLAVPYVEYVSGQGWDFEVWVDLAISFPELDGFTLPPVEDVIIGPDGVQLPAVQIPSLPAMTLATAGFQLTPLAFRMDPLQLDLFGGSPPADWGFSFDLELALGQLPATASPELRDLRLTVLDASYDGTAFTGTVETRVPAAPIPVPAGEYGTTFSLTELRGSLAAGSDGQEVALEVDARWTPPDVLTCPDLPADGVELSANATIALDGAGVLSGSVQGVASPCPFVLDPFRLEVSNADLLLAAGPDGQEARLDVDATLFLPSPAGDSASATGALVLDVLEPQVVSGRIDITEPFLWDVPAEAPFLRFTVSQGRLDADGLTLGGSGSLLLEPDQSVTATFSDLQFALPSLELVGGSATIESTFALDGAIDNGALDWAVRATDAPEPASPSLRLELPAPVTVDPQGVTISGSGSARVAFADSVFAGLAAEFENGFRVAFDPVTVTDGRAGLILNQTEIAYIDAAGFHPGDIFGVVPVPARLGLPTEDIAYLQLRDPATDALLIESGAATDGYRLNTRPNETVRLVLPALAGAQADTPAVDVSFDIVVDDQTMAVVSGAIEASVPATSGTGLFGLADLGLPLQVRRVGYDSDRSAMTVDARLELPAAMDVAVDFDSLTLGADGLSGTAELGSYRANAPADATVVTADLGVLELEVEGARATFGADPSFELGGAFRMELFAEDGQPPAPLPFTAAVTTGGVEVAADPSQLPNGRLPLGVATFEPVSPDLGDAIEVTATDTELTLGFSGVLRAPSLADGFAVTIEGLEVGTGGVSVDGVGLAGTGEQTLGLFGLELTLRSVDNQPAFDATYAAGVLRLVMSGELDFFGTGAEFAGLEVGTDGSFGMASAELLIDSVDIVPETVILTGLGIENDSLAVDFLVDLPAPLDGGGRQEATLRIASDGSVSGDGRVALIQETQGLGGDRTQFGTPVATAHLRYLGLQLNTTDLSSNAVEVVSDIYIANEETNRVELGATAIGSVTPGLRVGFDGTVDWHVEPLAQPLEFDFLDVLLLEVSDVSPSTDAGVLTLGLSGGLGLDLNAVAGSVDFDDFRVSSDLEFDASDMSVTSGALTISGLVSVQLNEFGFSPSDTTITVEGGSMPDGTNGGLASAETEQLAVSSFVRFGGALSLGSDCGGADPSSCLFSGGVREFLFYRTQADDRVGFVADSVTLMIPDVLDMQAEMEFHERADGFELQVGGNAVIQGKSFRAVGAIDNSGPELRAGVFLAVSQEIPIIPPILMLTEVGGGFFYNPKAEYIDLVHQYADVPNLARDSVSASAAVGKFTGLIYARAAVGTDQLGDARVLMTASEQGVQLDGLMAVLQTGGDRTSAPIRGTLHLLMGFDPVFAEGDFAMTLDYSPVLTGSQGLAFYVYDNAWGVWGNGSMEMFEVLDGSADFIVGPKGFYAEGGLDADIDFWIITAYGDADGSIWYLSSPRDWGAYMRLAVGVDLFSGAITADATMHAALVSDLPNPPYAYGGAEARGCFLGKCARLNVHMKVVDGQVSGGIGRDWELEQEVMDRAKRVASEMEQSAADMIAAVEAARPEPDVVALDDSELAAAYERLQTLSTSNALSLFSDAQAMEESFYPDYTEEPGESLYYDWYGWMTTQAQVPEADGYPMTLSELRGQVANQLQMIDTREPNVVAELEAINVQIDDLQDAVDEPWPTSPVLGASTAGPSTVVQGDRKVLVSGPDFDVDAQAAADAQQSMRDREQAAAARRQEVWERLDQITDGLESVRFATMSKNNSPVQYASLYASTMSAAEQQWARHADSILRTQDWLRHQLDTLAIQHNDILYIILNKSAELRMNAPERLDDLAEGRARHLAAISGNSSILTDYLNQAASDPLPSWYVEQADTLGLQLWYDLARAGMEQADAQATTEFEAIRTAAPQALAPIRSAHEDLTLDLNAMFRKRAELTGSVYDLYDRFQLWFDTAGVGTAAASTFDPTIFDQDVANLSDAQILTQLGAGKAQLATELQTPDLITTEVTVVRRGYLSHEIFEWSGTHPSGQSLLEYLFDDRAGEVGFFGIAGMRTAGGGVGRYNRFAFADGRNTSPETRTLRAAARGGAGYLAFGRTFYERSYPGDSSQGTYSQTYTREPDDSPPSRPWVTIEPATSADTIWLGDGTRMGRATWSSFDYESGIDEYAYAIGAAPLGGSIGLRPAMHRDWTSTGGRTEVEVNETALSMDSVYKVMVRAWNADRLSSNPGYSKPFRMDTTAPVFAGELQPPSSLSTTTETSLDADGSLETTTFTFTRDYSLDLSQPRDPPVDSLNSWAWAACPLGPSTLITVESDAYALTRAAVPYIELVAPDAVDHESGVDGYWWRADRDTTRLVSTDPWTRLADGQVRFEARGEPLTYQDSFYVSLVATNRAGLPSEPVVYGPFTPADTTAPVPPRYCIAQADADRLALHFEHGGGDPETGIERREYRVRTADGTVISPWTQPADWQVDPPGSDESFMTPALTLQSGTEYYVDTRVRNGDDDWSWSSSGPLQVDDSPPPAPSVTVIDAVAQPDAAFIDISLNVPDDPESGLLAIHWTVLDPNTGLQLEGELDSGDLSLDPTARLTGGSPLAGTWDATIALTRTELRLGPDDPFLEPQTQYVLVVYTVNGAGMPGPGGSNHFMTR